VTILSGPNQRRASELRARQKANVPPTCDRSAAQLHNRMAAHTPIEHDGTDGPTGSATRISPPSRPNAPMQEATAALKKHTSDKRNVWKNNAILFGAFPLTLKQNGICKQKTKG
jgi:hypothetical protein